MLFRLSYSWFWCSVPSSPVLQPVTEASGVGAMSAIVLAALYRRLNIKMLREALHENVQHRRLHIRDYRVVPASSPFVAVRGLSESDEIIEGALKALPVQDLGIILIILFAVFLMGFFLDWIEITFIILPLVAPVVANMDIAIDGFGSVDKPVLVWFTILIAVTLQTSYLTPPVGYAAVLSQRCLARRRVEMAHIYRGIIPFVILQMVAVLIIFFWPWLVTWLPAVVYG